MRIRLEFVLKNSAYRAVCQKKFFLYAAKTLRDANLSANRQTLGKCSANAAICNGQCGPVCMAYTVERPTATYSVRTGEYAEYAVPTGQAWQCQDGFYCFAQLTGWLNSRPCWCAGWCAGWCTGWCAGCCAGWHLSEKKQQIWLPYIGGHTGGQMIICTNMIERSPKKMQAAENAAEERNMNNGSCKKKTSVRTLKNLNFRANPFGHLVLLSVKTILLLKLGVVESTGWICCFH